MFDKIWNFLRKIGVISYGSQGWKGDAKDKPVSMMGNDVNLQAMQREKAAKKKDSQEK